jgi:hypothetical protein
MAQIFTILYPLRSESMGKKRLHVRVDWTDWALLRVYMIAVLDTYCVGLQVGPVCCEVTSENWRWRDAYIEITD